VVTQCTMAPSWGQVNMMFTCWAACAFSAPGIVQEAAPAITTVIVLHLWALCQAAMWTKAHPEAIMV